MLGRSTQYAFLGRAQLKLCRRGLLILTYHRIRTAPDRAPDPFLYDTPEALDTHLTMAKQAGLRLILFTEALSGAPLEPNTAMVTYRLIRYGIIAFALVVAYPYIPGSGSDAFKGISVFTGVLLSIGASSIVANTVSGYMLIYRKAFSLGDMVRIGEQVGRVADIRQQVSVLMTPKNEQVFPV